MLQPEPFNAADQPICWDAIILKHQFGTGFLSTTELYDPSTKNWSATGSLITARAYHSATLLPNGKVLAVGGELPSYPHEISSTELYDVGLGFSASWQPQIAPFNPPLSLGSSLVFTGSQFRGVSEGCGGDTQNSPANTPVLQLRAIESGQTLFVLSTSWSTNSYTSTPVTNFPPGYAMVTVFVNGISSSASILNIEDLSAFAITSILQQGNAIRIIWQTYAGETNVVQVAPGTPGGNYSNNFADLTPPIIVAGTGLVTTNWLDSGAATNTCRYYRVRLVP